MRVFKVNIAILLFLTACSSSSVIKINSYPTGAKVQVRNMESKTSQSLGETPLTVEGSTLEDKKIGDGMLVVELEKLGYHKQTLILTEVVDVDAEISLNLKPIDETEMAASFDKATEKMFEVQRLIRGKNYGKALSLVKEIKKRIS